MKYINTEERYGEQVEVTIEDYKALNPGGIFIESDHDDAIKERINGSFFVVATAHPDSLAEKYGAVEFEGATYILTGQADFTSRTFPGDFNSASEGESYTTELAADAIDAEGNPYQVYWQFAAVKGEEPEPDRYDYSSENVSRVWPQ